MEERGDIIAAYHKRFHGNNKEVHVATTQIRSLVHVVTQIRVLVIACYCNIFKANLNTYKLINPPL